MLRTPPKVRQPRVQPLSALQLENVEPELIQVHESDEEASEFIPRTESEHNSLANSNASAIR
jgi:hypothetical protein